MAPLLTPVSRSGEKEYLDEDVEPGVRLRSHRDIAKANRYLGGVHAVDTELAIVVAGGLTEISLLDIGTGIGDIPARVARRAARRGTIVRLFGLDGRLELIAEARAWDVKPVCGDALALPFADRSVDVVCCSQLLHHFSHAQAVAALREMHRVARRRVIVSDLRRSRVAATWLWLVSFPLSFHPVSRHDGVVSVMRGFTGGELGSLVREAVGREPQVRHRFPYRVTASWNPGG